MQRISEVDMEELSQRYGVDADRARAFADAARRWLNDHLSAGDPLFGHVQHPDDDGALRPLDADLDVEGPPEAAQTPPDSGAGPHPLDLPTDQQGLVLSALALDSWSLGRCMAWEQSADRDWHRRRTGGVRDVAGLSYVPGIGSPPPGR